MYEQRNGVYHHLRMKRSLKEKEKDKQQGQTTIMENDTSA
jgi:hypothetical protein